MEQAKDREFQDFVIGDPGRNLNNAFPTGNNVYYNRKAL